MPVKHVGPDTNDGPHPNEAHVGKKGEKTGCGFDTTKHPSHWGNANEKITCGRSGCK